MQRWLSAISVKITGSNEFTQDGFPPIDRSSLQDILDTLDSMDVLAGAADNLTRQMRGGFEPDGITPKPADNPSPLRLFRFAPDSSAYCACVWSMVTASSSISLDRAIPPTSIHQN